MENHDFYSVFAFSTPLFPILHRPCMVDISIWHGFHIFYHIFSFSTTMIFNRFHMDAWFENYPHSTDFSPQLFNPRKNKGEIGKSLSTPELSSFSHFPTGSITITPIYFLFLSFQKRKKKSARENACGFLHKKKFSFFAPNHADGIEAWIVRKTKTLQKGSRQNYESNL